MSWLRRYSMAVICGLAALGFGALSLLSSGLIERLFYLLGCVINAGLFGSWWAIERIFPQREHAAELFLAADRLMRALEAGKPIRVNGRLYAVQLEPEGNKPPTDAGEEGPGI